MKDKVHSAWNPTWGLREPWTGLDGCGVGLGKADVPNSRLWAGRGTYWASQWRSGELWGMVGGGR